jgi:hypothetical protein
MRKMIVCCLFLSVLPFFTSNTWAEFKITPSISLREEYDDNIYLTADDEEADFITSIYPSVSLSYITNLLRLSLDFGFNFRFYAHNPDENDTDSTQTAKLEATIAPYKDIFFIRLFDEYKRVAIDEREQVALDNSLVNMTDSNNFMINPYFVIPLSGTLKTNIGYTYNNQWYKEESGDNTTEHIFNAALTKELSSRLAASLSYAYVIHDAEETEDYNGEDYNRHEASVGLNYQVTQKLSLSGSYGRAWFDYERRDDEDTNFWDTSARYQLTERISLTAGYSRSFEDSVDAGTYVSDAVRVSITRQSEIPVTVSVFKQKSDYLSDDREDKSTGVTVSAGYQITPRITGNLTGSYTDYEFLPEGEDVTRYSAGPSLNYALNITTVSLGYTYNYNNSTVDVNDYKNNIIWLQTRFTF